MPGTKGRVYGGNCKLIHVADGKRAYEGKMMASHLDLRMRKKAVKEGMDYRKASELPLCPGCYMVVSFNMLVELAKQNGQSLAELGSSMSQAFLKLAECKDSEQPCIESIEVLLDPPQQQE